MVLFCFRRGAFSLPVDTFCTLPERADAWSGAEHFSCIPLLIRETILTTDPRFATLIKDYFELFKTGAQSHTVETFKPISTRNDGEQRDGERVTAPLYTSAVTEHYVHHARVKGKSQTFLWR